MVLAGPGAPLVAEFCIAEFALAIGRSTDSGRALIAHAVEVKYRLPRTWAQILSGDLQVWRARRIAELTLRLTAEAAAFVDTQSLPSPTASASPPRSDSSKRPSHGSCPRPQPSPRRQQPSGGGSTSTPGTSPSTAPFSSRASSTSPTPSTSKTPSPGAPQSLKAAGSDQGLDVRRSQALGELARHQLALDLAAESASSTGVHAPKPRQVVLYVHLSDAAIRGEAGLHLARVENHRLVVTADQVKTWCANPDTNVVVKPVIDLDEHVHVEAYEAPERLDEQQL